MFMVHGGPGKCGNIENAFSLEKSRRKTWKENVGGKLQEKSKENVEGKLQEGIRRRNRWQARQGKRAAAPGARN